jgi:hypothetical protein
MRFALFHAAGRVCLMPRFGLDTFGPDTNATPNPAMWQRETSALAHDTQYVLNQGALV